MNTRVLGFLCLLLAALMPVVGANPGDLMVEVRHTLGDALLVPGQTVLTNASGNVLSVTRLDYLLSDFVLERSDARTVVLTNQFAYVSAGAERNRFTLTGVPKDRFTALRFRVGVAPGLNHADPAGLPPGHPLNPAVNGLHWSWQGGYVFLALEGIWRDSDERTGGWSYHLATDALAIPVEVRTELTTDGTAGFRLTFDVARVFSGTHSIRLGPATASTHSRPGDGLAVQLKDNVVQAFRAESICSTRRDPADPSVASRREMAVGATPFRFKRSRHFPQPILPADNPMTEEGVALGLRLFGDVALSVNGTQSCASCHQAGAALADPGKAFSVGAEGQTGSRNAMPLVNLAWQSSFGWDGHARSLREQALRPITNPVEMHESLANVVGKLDRAGYAAAFAAAFGSREITPDRVARGLEQYLLTLTSHDSKFDRVLLGTDSLTSDEQRGFELFHTEYDPRHGQFGADCFHCHGGPLFSDFAFHNNGLDASGSVRDLGRSLVTTNRSDRAKFKTPSLRNVAVTGPYMHDGRFGTLEAAVAHYAVSVQRSPTLDPNLAKHPDGGVPLSPQDQGALVAFLRTLTDSRWSPAPVVQEPSTVAKGGSARR